MSEAKWYVAHTYSGYENKVAKSLEAIVENRRLHDLIQDIKVPTESSNRFVTGASGVVVYNFYTYITN